MTKRTKILCFAGSARRDSLNKKLARAAARTAEEHGAEVTFVDLNDYEMPLYHGDLETESGIPENAYKLRDLFLAHQGIFIASPEYNAGYSPLIKNTLDWITRIRIEGQAPQAPFKDRVFAISTASTGGYGGMRSLPSLRHIMSTGYGALVISEQLALAHADKAFDENGILVNEGQAQMLERVVKRLVDLAARE